MDIYDIYALGFLIVVGALYYAYNETRKKLASSSEENYLILSEKEKVEKLYADAIVERDTLSKMAEATSPDAEMKVLINHRLAILNKVIASYITDSYSANKEANAQIEMLVSNREAFLESTRKSFEAGYPQFMRYLRSCGLTDWEVNYCCLYLVGLNGKEIGEYINLKAVCYALLLAVMFSAPIALFRRSEVLVYAIIMEFLLLLITFLIMLWNNKTFVYFFWKTNWRDWMKTSEIWVPGCLRAMLLLRPRIQNIISYARP